MDKTYEYRSQIGLPSNAGEKLYLQRLTVSVMCKMQGACNWIFDGDIDLLFKNHKLGNCNFIMYTFSD